MIPNPSCSELVVALGLTDPEDIREALKTAEEVTGWKLGIRIEDWKTDGEFYTVVRPEDIVVESDSEYIGIRKDILPDEIAEDEGRYYITICLIPPDIPLNRWIDRRDRFGELTDPLRIAWTDGYCDTPLVFEATQHVYSPHFEPLYRIAMTFRKIWHSEDGGSTHYMDEYVAKHHREEATKIARKILSDPKSSVEDQIFAERLLDAIEVTLDEDEDQIRHDINTLYRQV
jgi:hypothetical protein